MTNRVEPSRLTLARRLNRKSKTQLAGELGVSLAALSQWEAGTRDASGRVEDLARLLNQPVAFFYGCEVHRTSPELVSFRKRHDATKSVREYSAAVLDLSADILTPAIRTVIGSLPLPSLPRVQPEDRLSPEKCAEFLRKEWRLSDGPLRSSVEQLEARGVRIVWVDTGNPALSALCKWIGSEPFVVLNSAKRDGCRSRFDAIHELGHLVQHWWIDFDEVDAKKVEREADQFASAFLLPKESFLDDAPRTFDRDGFLELKKVWKVSVQAMVRRLYDLGVFSPWQYEHAFRQMSSWGWRSNPEPLAGSLESSRVHTVLCERLSEKNILPREFADSIGVNWSIVATHMPVLQEMQISLSFSKLSSSDCPFDLDSPSESLPYDD